MLSNPAFDKLAEFASLVYQIICFRFRGYVCAVIIDLVSLSPASVEIRDKRRNVGAHGDFHGLEGRKVVTWTGCAIPCAGDRYFGQLEDRVVGRRKPAVRRKPRQRRVLQVPLNEIS